MANIRDLKKDIDYLVYEVISDCFTVMTVKPTEKHDDLVVIVADAVKLRNDLFARAKHPDGKNDTKMVKTHYTKIREDLLKGADSLFERLSAITRK